MVLAAPSGSKALMASGADLMGALLPSVASQLSWDGGGQVSADEEEM